MARSLVSILVPSFNHDRFLRAAIESVLAQSVEDWALIIVDDGSRDGSVEIAREFAARDSRIGVWVNDRNLGTYGALARGLELADLRDRRAGRYVAVLNSDDRWAPDKLARQLASFESHPEAPVCYTLGWKLDPSGAVDESEDVHADWSTEPVQELLPRLLYQNRILASSVLFRAEAVEFDNSLRYSGDWVALLNPAKEAPFTCVAERLTFWRMHAANSYVRSVPQVTEEIRIRSAILSRPTRWFIPRLPAGEVRQGLGMNSAALAALEMLRGRRRAAIHAALVAVRYLPGSVTLRRLAACLLPNGRERLWPGDTTRFENPSAPLPLPGL